MHHGLTVTAWRESNCRCEAAVPAGAAARLGPCYVRTGTQTFQMSALWQILRGKIEKYFIIFCCRFVRELPRVDAVKKCPRNPTGNSWKSLVWKVCASSQISHWELHAGNIGANISPGLITENFLIQEESPEGGRFKKEVVVDGQSFLLLIRDEGGPPELQVTHHHSGLKSKK